MFNIILMILGFTALAISTTGCIKGNLYIAVVGQLLGGIGLVFTLRQLWQLLLHG